MAKPLPISRLEQKAPQDGELTYSSRQRDPEHRGHGPAAEEWHVHWSPWKLNRPGHCCCCTVTRRPREHLKGEIMFRSTKQ